MRRREARDESPTAAEVQLVEEYAPKAEGGLQFLTDLRTALLAGGRTEGVDRRESRMMSILERRKDEVTMTLMLMLDPSEAVAYFMNNALLGMRYDKDLESLKLGAAKPLFASIELQSLRRSCAKCRAHNEDAEHNGPCPRQGKYHDVTYKTGQKSGTADEHRLILAMGGTLEDNVLCEVDPDTGRFSLPPLEAKKALTQWGENALRPTRRWVDRQAKKGDRWLIREVRHHEQYGNALIGAEVRKDIQPMSAE